MKIFICSKSAHREFRRLYHLEEKHRHQLLTGQESELNEQQSEFHRKRESIRHQFDLKLKFLEEKFSRQNLDRINYEEEKHELLRRQEEILCQIEEEELRSRYDLLRKQTKSFYSFFRQMLREQSEKELEQFNQHVQEEEKILQTYLINERQSWRRNQQKRYEQFLNRQKFNGDHQYLLRKVRKHSERNIITMELV